MRLIVLISFTLLSTAILTPWSVSASTTDEVWVILNARTGFVLPDLPHGLKNTNVNKMLVKQKQAKGIDLGWAAPSNFDQTFTFHKKDQATTPVKYGEAIALSVYLGGEKYLHYQRGTGGPELTFSKTPLYEWTFTGGTAGEPVRPWVEKKGAADREIKVGLYNNSKKAALISADPPEGKQLAGVGLRWSRQVIVAKDPEDDSKCTFLVIVTGTYSPHTDAIGVFTSVSENRGEFLQKYPVNTVHDQRKEKQAQTSYQASLSLAAGEYFLVPAGGGQDKQGFFGNIYEPRQQKIACQPGKVQRVLFRTNFAEY